MTPVPPPSRSARLISAFSAEARKILATRAWWAALLSLGAVTLLAACVFRFFEQPSDPTTIYNGFGCLSYAASVGTWIGGFVLLIFGALGTAQEREWGTLAQGLLGPVSRGDLFWARSMVLLGAVLAVFGAVVITAAAAAGIFYGFGDVVEVIPFGDTLSRYVHHKRNFMINRSLLAAALSLPPLAATAFLGQACSTLFRRPAAAVGASAIVYVGLEFVVKRFSDQLGPYVFNAYTDWFWEILLRLSRGITTAAFQSEDSVRALTWSAGSAIFFLIVSFIALRYRDID